MAAAHQQRTSKWKRACKFSAARLLKLKKSPYGDHPTEWTLGIKLEQINAALSSSGLDLSKDGDPAQNRALDYFGGMLGSSVYWDEQPVRLRASSAD